MKKILSMFILAIIVLSLSVSASAVSALDMTVNDTNSDYQIAQVTNSRTSSNPNKIVDSADVLSTDEELLLMAKIDDLIKKLDIDIAIVTTYDLQGSTSQAYADDYFDYNGYGLGPNHDGVLLLVDFGSNEWHISTTGSAINLINDNEIDAIGSAIVPFLKNKSYYSAFDTFLNELSNAVLEPVNVPFVIIVSLIAGIIVSAIVCFILVRQLKSVKKQNLACEYVKPGTFKTDSSRDVFLYDRTTVTAKPKESGSSTHRGSSGRSHGGGGGSF